MATAQNVIEGALKLLGVQAAETPIEASEAIDGLDALNNMMAEWEEDGIHTGFIPLQDITTTVNVPNSAIGAIKAKLALYVAPEYNKVVTIALAARAKDSFTSLRASLVRLNASEFPDTLPRGSGNERNNFNATGDVPGNQTDRNFYPANEKRNF